MTSAQLVETSFIATLNSPSQDYIHSDDRTSLKDGPYYFKDIFASVYDHAGNVVLNKCY